MSQKLAAAVSDGSVDPASIDESTVNKFMWSGDLGPVDFLIRTSGEQRISNFYLWSLAYAELFFSNYYWPDFGDKALDEALDAFQQRNRRFGLV